MGSVTHLDFCLTPSPLHVVSGKVKLPSPLMIAARWAAIVAARKYLSSSRYPEIRELLPKPSFYQSPH